MNTRVLLHHEPVADGGFVARAVLVIEGSVPCGGADTDTGSPGPPGASGHGVAAAMRICAEDVRVSVFPGRDAEFIQMRHACESRGSGARLTIRVGTLYALDRVRIRMEALVGRGEEPDGEAEVGRLVVTGRLRSGKGVELQSVELPIRVSAERGGRVSPQVSRMPVDPDTRDEPWVYSFSPLDLEGEPPLSA